MSDVWHMRFAGSRTVTLSGEACEELCELGIREEKNPDRVEVRGTGHVFE